MSRYSVSRRHIKNDCAVCGKPLRIRASKYCSNECQIEFQFTKKIPDIIEGKVASRSPSVRKLLEREFGYKCSCCELSEWQEQAIPLDVDHIDGDPSNDKFKNLRFLCPNCHRLTDTWGNSSFKRQLRKEGKPGRVANGSLVK